MKSYTSDFLLNCEINYFIIRLAEWEKHAETEDIELAVTLHLIGLNHLGDT